MSSITWRIVNLEYQVNTGGVIISHWQCQASQGDISTTSYGVVELNPNPDSSNFVPYEDLTESIVVGWTKDKLGQEEIERIELKLLEELDKIINPEIISGLPWVQQPDLSMPEVEPVPIISPENGI